MNQHNDTQTPTSREALEVTLEGIATGVIGVEGVARGELKPLDQMILPLSGPQDGSLKRGDDIPFGDGCRAEIVAVGTVVTDEHVDYHVKLYTG